jgi:hypothetical protein
MTAVACGFFLVQKAIFQQSPKDKTTSQSMQPLGTLALEAREDAKFYDTKWLAESGVKNNLLAKGLPIWGYWNTIIVTPHKITICRRFKSSSEKYGVSYDVTYLAHGSYIRSFYSHCFV